VAGEAVKLARSCRRGGDDPTHALPRSFFRPVQGSRRSTAGAAQRPAWPLLAKRAPQAPKKCNSLRRFRKNRSNFAKLATRSFLSTAGLAKGPAWQCAAPSCSCGGPFSVFSAGLDAPGQGAPARLVSFLRNIRLQRRLANINNRG
jgi:hypothetical protein